MALPPDKAKVITLSELSRIGAVSITINAVTFDPPPGNRGIQKSMRPVLWKASITAADATFPSIHATRDNPGEAFKDAAARFHDMTVNRRGRKPASEDDLI